MKTLYLLTKSKYESMNMNVTIGHSVYSVLFMTMGLYELAQFTKLGISQEISKWLF